MLDPKQREWVKKMAGLVTKNLADSPVRDGEDGAGAGGGTGGGQALKKDGKAPGTDSTRNADLPQPMLPDCKVVKGAIPGPDNIVLCSMHGHIIDTATKQIVANNLKEFLAQKPEYGKLPMDMLPDCVAEKGKLQGPANHLLCSTHGHVLDIKAKKVIAYSPADYRKRFAPKKAPAGSDKKSPPVDEKGEQEKLRNILSGAAIFINDFQGRKAEFDKDMDKLAHLCPDAVSGARQAMTDAIASLRAHNLTAGEWISRSDLWVPADIPSKSQAARNALTTYSSAMDKLRKCVDNPPPLPDPGPIPSDPRVDPAALKAQRDLIRRRDRMDALRAFEGSLKSLGELVGKIDHELEKAKNLASRMQVAR
jgi:hypothetical protein